MKHKFLLFALLGISVIGIILLVVGYRLGANVGMIVDGMKDVCVELFQWSEQIFHEFSFY